MSIIVLILIIVVFISAAVIGYQYKQSDYYKKTGKPIGDVLGDDGTRGEYCIYKSLSVYEEGGARFLYNCYIPAGYGKTTEIDLIMLHSLGVFVFESKNYGGWIFGSDDRKMWTQTLPGKHEVEKNHFYNPVMQNRNHVKHLRSLIGKDYPVYSIVVFSDDCEFKDVQIQGTDTIVTQFYGLRDAVYKLMESNINVLSQDMINMLYSKLEPYMNASNDVRIKHISDIKQKYGTDSVERCPKCGGRLVLREAKKGQYLGKKFYGCSNYPRCHYIRNLDDIVSRASEDNVLVIRDLW